MASNCVAAEHVHQSGGNLGAKAIEEGVERTHAIKESKVVQESKDEPKYETSVEVPEHLGVRIPQERVQHKGVLGLDGARHVGVVGHQLQLHHLHPIDVCGKRRDVLGCDSMDVKAPDGDENGDQHEHSAHTRG
eukprot:1237084-Prymnesium_polylepis.2